MKTLALRRRLVLLAGATLSVVGFAQPARAQSCTAHQSVLGPAFPGLTTTGTINVHFYNTVPSVVPNSASLQAQVENTLADAASTWTDSRLDCGGNGHGAAMPAVSLRALDMFGLADAHIAHSRQESPGFRTVGHEKFDPDYVLRRRVDYLFSRLDEAGRPTTAGLGAVSERVDRKYRLVLQVKDRLGAPSDGTWVREVAGFSGEWWGKGFRSGLFERRK